MPGLVGFAGEFDPENAHNHIHTMAKAMSDQNWYKVETYIGEDVCFGRASLGLLNPEPQPIWNEDKTLCIVMEGEIFDYQESKQELVHSGHDFKVNNDAEFILHLFEEQGEDFAAQLNGAFVVAIWNQEKRELILVNDRLGLRPIYYAFYKGFFSFASGVRALLVDLALSRIVDPVAIAQMLTFEYPLDNRTLLTQVKLLLPASILTFHNGKVDIKSYWQLRFKDDYEFQKTEEVYIEGLIYHIRKAVTRQAPGDLPAGINLSGGLDSRLLLGLLSEDMEKESLTAYSWGIPGCDDVRIGRELAHVAGVQHHFLELKADYLPYVVDNAVKLTDGMESCIHIHALANLKDQAKHVRLLYSGYLMDSLISPDATRNWFANYDDDTVRGILFDDLNKEYLFAYSEHEKLFTKRFHIKFKDEFLDSFDKVMAEAKANLLFDWQNNLELLQRQRRFTENGNEIMRSQVITRTPFCDNELVEYALAIPPGLRLNQYIYIKTIARAFNKLAKVPWENTGYPLVECARDLMIRIKNQTRWRLQAAGLNWIPNVQNRPYADYNHWMRTTLRPWVEEILLDERTLGRGYFNPDYIRKHVIDHMGGKNYANRLGVLLSLELWHRQFID